MIGHRAGGRSRTASLGISLRRRILSNGTGALRRDETRSDGISTPSPSNGSASALPHLTKERPEQDSRSGAAERAQAPTPCQAPAPWQEWAKKANEAGAASFAITMQYRCEERATELPLTQDMIGQLAFEAAFRNERIGELIGELIVAVLKKDLLQTVLEHKEAR
jgi:hypothetical protein